MAEFDPNALIQAGPIDSTKPPESAAEKIIVPDGEGDKPFDMSEFDTSKGATKRQPDSIDSKKALEYEEAAALEKLEKQKAKEQEDASKGEVDDGKSKGAKETSTEDKGLPKPPPTAKAQQDTTLPNKAGIVSDEDLKALGITDAGLPLFRKMSNDAREHVVAVLKRQAKDIENAKAELETTKKQVQEGVPQNWYEHEEAYQLLPDFKKAQGEIGQLRQYSNFYRQQLIAIKEGEKWVDLVMGADGKITQVERDPGGAADVTVMDKIRSLENAIQHREGMAGQIIHKFQAQNRGLQTKMTEINDHFFPAYKDGIPNKEAETYVQKSFEAIGQGNNPILGFVKRLYAFTLENLTKVEEYEKAQTKGKVISTMGNGPTGDEISKGESTKDKGKPAKVEDEPFDDNEWEKAKGNRQ